MSHPQHLSCAELARRTASALDTASVPRSCESLSPRPASVGQPRRYKGRHNGWGAEKRERKKAEHHQYIQEKRLSEEYEHCCVQLTQATNDDAQRAPVASQTILDPHAPKFVATADQQPHSPPEPPPAALPARWLAALPARADVNGEEAYRAPDIFAPLDAKTLVPPTGASRTYPRGWPTGASHTYPRSAAAEASQLGTNELLQQIIFKLEVMLNQQRSSKIDVIVKQIEQILSTNVDIVDLLQKLVALRVAHATAH